MRLRDRAFQTAFARLPVYNILWEDADVDARLLGLDERSSLFMISAAGCGVASALAARPASIDAVDINAHHLALTALKVRAAVDLASHEELYETFGRGRASRRRVAALAAKLPPWMRAYWRARAGAFRESVYRTGVTARMMSLARRLVDVDEAWLRGVARLPVEDRLREVDELFADVFERRLVRAAVESPLQLVALGINFAQRDRLLASHEATGLAAFTLDHLRRAARTDLDTNWFVWQAVLGRFNHDDPRAVPPYLRRESWERSFGAPTDVRFRNESVFARLAAAGPGAWSHYALCDAVDWMPHDAQRRLLEEVVRTARDGAVVLYRSVEDASLAERHGLSDVLVLREAESAEAALADRTRQYRRVNVYDVRR